MLLLTSLDLHICTAQADTHSNQPVSSKRSRSGKDNDAVNTTSVANATKRLNVRSESGSGGDEDKDHDAEAQSDEEQVEPKKKKPKTSKVSVIKISCCGGCAVGS